MKKVLFFAAMLSFAVACGGENKNDNNAEETVVETVEAVEEQAAPEVKAEAEQTVEAPEETKLVVNKVIENANCARLRRRLLRLLTLPLIRMLRSQSRRRIRRTLRLLRLT